MKSSLHIFLKTVWMLAILLCINSEYAFSSVHTTGSCDVACKQIGADSGSLANYIKPKGLDNYTLLNFSNTQENEENIDILIDNAFQFGGTNVSQIAQTVKDTEGNSYITGGFTGSMSIGSNTITSSNGYDVYVAKLDADNNLVWVRKASGATNIPERFSLDGGLTLAVDELGSVYAAGGFVKSLTFTDADGDTVETLTDGRDDENLNFEMFVVKYSSEGELEWADGGNSGSTGAPNSLAIDRNFVNSIMLDFDGYPYIAGAYSGSDFLGEETEIVGKSDFFLASLEIDGSEHFWVSTTGTPDDDYAGSISVDTLGYLNVLGVIGEGIMELPDSDDFWINDTGANDTFVISYDIDGEWYFANFIGGGDQAIGNDIATSPNGDFFVTGEFSESVFFPDEFDEGIVLETDAISEGFIAKYDLQGDILWAKQFGNGVFVTANRVTTDLEDNVYVLGKFSDFITFKAGAENSVTLVTDSPNDMFIAKYDNNGDFLWAKQIESTGSQSLDRISMGEEQPMQTQPLDLTFTSANNGELLLSGDFDETLSLDEITLTASENSRSSFVATYSLEQNTVSNEEPISDSITEFELMQNYPNPFNPSTTIGFNLAGADHVSIEVFNSTGQKVRTVVNGQFSKGQHQIKFDGTGLPSGMYFYTINSSALSETKSMTLIK